MRRLAADVETPAIAAGASAVAAFVLVELGPAAAFGLVLLPVIAWVGVYVITSGQAVIYALALAFSVLILPGVGTPLTGSLYVQDIFVGLALAAWIFSRFLGRGRVPPVPRTPVLGWPLVLFGAAIAAATIRGHYEYGTALLGQPLRLVFYAVIVAGLAGMTVPKTHRLLELVFYPVAAYAAVLALYHVATGGTTSDQDVLSTGGTRILGITTSLLCAGALFLALLNLRFGLGARMLHLTMAALASFGVVVGFGRAVYAAVAVVGLLLFITSRRLRSSILGVVPLTLPLLVLLAIGINHAAPELVDSVERRMFSPPETDLNVRWRVEANQAILPQVREQPLFGVGFGKGAEFFLEIEDPTTGGSYFQRIAISQDPHNGYVYLLAGGGLVALGSFVLLLGVFAGDALKRYRRNADPRARLIIIWACAMLFGYLLNAATGTSLSVPDNILTIWALLVLPAVVPAGDAGSGLSDPRKRAWSPRPIRRLQ